VNCDVSVSAHVEVYLWTGWFRFLKRILALDYSHNLLGTGSVATLLLSLA
jgi:hypothetical protein